MHQAFVSAALLLGTCSFVHATTQFVINSSPPGYYDANTIKGCSFWATVQSGNTCDALEQYFNVTQSQFLIYNPSVNDNCTNLIAGRSYCFEVNNGTGPTPTANPAALPPGATGDNNVSPSPVQSGFPTTCNNFYWVSQNTTCSEIVNFYGGAITMNQFISWNPAIANCSNLLVNFYVCTGVSTASTTIAPSSPPTTSSIASSSTSSGGPQPEQSGIASNCDAYYLVQSGDSCSGIVNKFNNFTLSTFYSWNPAVNANGNCGGLETGTYVCIGTTNSTSTTTSSSTASTHSVSSSSTGSQSITSSSTSSHPALSTSASTHSASSSSTTSTVTKSSTLTSILSSSLTSSTAASAPTPHQSGIAANCTKYYMCQSGDTCSSIAAQNGTFTVSQFEGWNPGAGGSSCNDLQVGFWYCVAVPGTPTTGAPSPHQSGIASNCNQYYLAKSGDTCSSIAAVNNTFTVSQFESWNPAVGSNCANLDVGDYYCVGVSS